jgi:hypothetical protein
MVVFMSPSQECLVIHSRVRLARKGPGIEARGWKKRWYTIQVRGPIASRMMVGHGRARSAGMVEDDDMAVDYYLRPMALVRRRDP